MMLKAHSVVVQEISDELANAVEAAFRDGKAIPAIALARQVLADNPDSGMTVDALTEWIGRQAATRGVTVEFVDKSN